MDKMLVRVPVAVKAKVTQDLKLKIIGIDKRCQQDRLITRSHTHI